jgi:Arc/MetJ family transcription regulator
MRTNIVLDDKLVREAMKLAHVKTKREAVDVALRRFVMGARQRRLLALKGSGGIAPGYDYKRARGGD